jgi:hypothetical protein
MLKHDAARRLVAECLDLLTDQTPAEIGNGIDAEASLTKLGVGSDKAVNRLKYMLAVHPLSGVSGWDYAAFQDELSEFNPSLSIARVIQTVAASARTGRTHGLVRMFAMGPLTGHEDTEEI